MPVATKGRARGAVKSPDDAGTDADGSPQVSEDAKQNEGQSRTRAHRMARTKSVQLRARVGGNDCVVLSARFGTIVGWRLARLEGR
jgi:hypothetical protein